MFADLFAYFVNGGAPNQLKGVSSLEGTRDPGNALTKAGTPKKWGKRQLDVFEGRASAERSLENGDPTFTGVHDVAAFLSYPMAKLLSDSLPGADATKKLDTLVRWLDAISAKLVKTRSPELSLDQLTALLVETIVAGKTADAKEFGSACSEFKLLVEGLEKTAAACK
ncbi:MAG: hypothetical protein NTV34_04515 [Proteobacteria bacterium]|nr:hypothetical protein [Pseudomonadota bacterium]